jgi:FdhD protein
MKGVVARDVLKISKFTISKVPDLVAVEEPLEIRISFGQVGRRESQNLLVTMRTPGYDHELITGLLFSEGIIKAADDIDKITLEDLDEHSTALVSLSPSAIVDPSNLKRDFFSSSSCGVCGKSSLDQLHTHNSPQIDNKDFSVDAALLYSLPGHLRSAQSVFDSTGGLHAVGLFNGEEFLFMYEDVGRHNAMDKMIGAALLKNLIPLSSHVALLSGRASFELIEKASASGIPIVACVGAPSSLAVKVAEEKGITLAGFLNQERFNIYTHAHRIICK